MNQGNFGVRWQSAAATPLLHFQSGVALRFPPQSKTVLLRLRASALKTK
jgi:hypothetical protein